MKCVECIRCGEEYPAKRKELGYNTCLDCGAQDAHRVSRARQRHSLQQLAPSYQGPIEDLFDDRGGSDAI